MKSLRLTLFILLATALAGCGDGDTTYSLLEDSESFRQTAGTQNNKIDVLWVVDNSGSMRTSQENLADNFPAFMVKFLDKKFDFQMAVTTTDAYLAISPTWDSYYNRFPRPQYYEGQAQSLKARFRDGVGSTHSGYRILNSLTPNLHSNFMINIMQGVEGRGDERSLQSMETALMSPHNQPFHRDDAFLAIIILTDEDDFSHPGTSAYESYVSQLTPISHYVSFLDQFTGTSGAARRYSVNSISVKDNQCLNSIYNGAQRIAKRVMELVDATGGISASLCGDFAEELDLIAKGLVQASTKFSLGDKRPIPETIRVFVNGVLVSSEGWFYEQETNSIVFNDGYAPADGDLIKVTFDPESLSF